MDIKRYLKVGALTSALLLPMVAFAQKDPNLAKTPPMGWNSWNKFQCNLNEQMVREIADAMVATGMRDVVMSML
jgi:alpha-galactosidase